MNIIEIDNGRAIVVDHVTDIEVITLGPSNMAGQPIMVDGYQVVIWMVHGRQVHLDTVHSDRADAVGEVRAITYMLREADRHG